MGAGRSGVTYFCDRNLGSRVPDGLETSGWTIEKHDDHYAQDIEDEILLPDIASRNWVLITQDDKMRRRPAEKRALIESDLRVFSVASTANLSAEQTIEILQNARRAIDQVLEREPGPFIYGIWKDSSLHKMEL